MKRILFYILIPVLVIGLGYFVWTKQETKMSLQELIYEDDLAILNLPNVTDNYVSWSENTMFQHLLQLEGFSDIKSLYQETAKQFDVSYGASALITVRSSGDVLLAIELEEEQNQFFVVNDLFEKQIDSTIWYVQRKGNLLLASKNKSLVNIKVGVQSERASYNFNQLFFHINSQAVIDHFSLPKDDQFYHTLSELAKNVNHSLAFNDSKVSASGFDFDESKQLHKLLAGQQSEGFELSPFILVNFLSMKSLQFQNGKTFVFRNKYEVEPAVFNDFGGAEVTYQMGQAKESKVVILKSEDVEGLAKEFGIIEDSEEYGFSIYSVNNENVLNDFFGDYFSVKPKLLAEREDVLVLAEDKESLSFYLKKLSHNQVWYHSYEQMKWVENELIYNNCIYVAKLPAVVHAFDKSPQIQSYYNRNKDLISALPYLLVQQSKEATGIYEGVSMVYDQNTQPEIRADVITIPEIETQIEEQKEGEVLASFDSKISSKPIPVKNYITGQLQFLLIDENNVLRLVSNTGKEEWKFKLDGELVSEVSEIDVFKNKKLQYIFATDKKLYCVDRLGRMVENFPITLPKGDSIQGFSLIDYNQSKNYRLALNSKRNVWLYDVTGKMLDGWNPVKFESDLVGGMKHYRYQTKDYLLALEKSGKVNVLKRKGTSYEGYPLDTKMSLLTNDVYMDKDEKISKSGFSFVSDQGMVMKYGMSGSLLTAEKLPVPAELGEVFIESNQSHYRYAANVGEEVFIFDSKLNQKMKLEVDDQLTGFQMYELSDQDVYVFIFGDYLRLINQKGEVVLDDIPSANEISLYYSSKNGKGFIYYTAEDKLMKQGFKLSK